MPTKGWRRTAARPATHAADRVGGRSPSGELHSPYQDYAKLAKDDPDLVKQFRLPGCNECHGGTGGGGFCPALTQGVWFWGNTDDVLFRLATLGSAELEKRGFVRYQYGSVHAPMPPMGFSIKTSDQLWKIIAFIRSINPPGANPPEKVIPGRCAPPAKLLPARGVEGRDLRQRLERRRVNQAYSSSAGGNQLARGKSRVSAKSPHSILSDFWSGLSMFTV